MEGIKKVRVSLLAEDSGLLNHADAQSAIEAFANPHGLVARLDALTSERCATASARYCHRARAPDQRSHRPGSPALRSSTPDHEDDELAYEEEHAQSRPLFIGGLTGLWERLKPG
jgi:hypothetical protein